MKKFLSVFLVVAALSLSACSSRTAASQSPAVSTNGLSPEQTVETAFKSLKNCDTQTFNKLIEYKDEKKGNVLYADNKLFGNSLNESGKKFIGLLFDKFSYKIIKTEQKNDTATVETKITNSDFSSLDIAKYSGSYNPLFAAMENNESKTVSDDIKLNLVKKDGEWKIQLGESAFSTLCGGFDPFSEISGTVSEVKGLLS